MKIIYSIRNSINYVTLVFCFYWTAFLFFVAISDRKGEEGYLAFSVLFLTLLVQHLQTNCTRLKKIREEYFLLFVTTRYLYDLSTNSDYESSYKYGIKTYKMKEFLEKSGLGREYIFKNIGKGVSIINDESYDRAYKIALDIKNSKYDSVLWKM